jgi:ubiquitin C-terminal hydrolase
MEALRQRETTYRNVLALQNTGNICYLNCALQCLLCISEFRDCVQALSLHELSELCKKYEDPNVPLANPIMVKQLFGKYDPFFMNNMQQDSHECLIRIIDIIHENMAKNSTQKRTIATRSFTGNPSKVAWDQYIKMFGGSFITDIFGGQIKSTLVCQICNKERDSYETINNLSLPLARPQNNNVVDIVDCFRSFFAPEQLEDLLTCDHCRARTPTMKYMKLWIFPKVLILHLKRYTASPYTLTAGHTASPYTLTAGHTASPYTLTAGHTASPLINNVMVETSENLVFRGEATPNDVRYNLKCIVNHFGASPNSGHYTTLCVAWLRHGDRTRISSFENEWINIDDSNIYRTAARSKNLFTSPSSYVLIYERAN